MDNVKILIVGPSGVGKTTLRRVFFDQDNPLKLITETLEPTYGVETTLYNLGGKIAIHDLAGQQLDDFLSISADIFVGSDLILAILDSTDSWENNAALWQRIDGVRQEYCPDAFLSVFLHKIDLLTADQRLTLEQSAREFAGTQPNTNTFLTSIDRHFFFGTYQAFMTCFRQSLFRQTNAIPQDFFVKLDILSQFAEKNTTTLDDLITKLGADSDLVRKNLQELEAKGYIILKDAIRRVELSEIGQYIVQTTQNNLFLLIQESLSAEIEFIKAMLLSDKAGRTILLFETTPDFIRTLGGANNSNDPAFIPMFISAIGNFGQTFDPQGFSSIQLIGRNLQLVAQAYGDLVGLFFISNITVDQTLISLLRQFVFDCFVEYRPELEQFLRSGQPDIMSEKRDVFVQKIRKLNDALQNMALLNQTITKDKLLSLYQRILGQELTQDDSTTIKTLLFHYLITLNPSLVDELFATMGT